MNDTSTNLSKIKREHLLNICSKIKNGEIVDITEITELEQFIKSMKYGLTFEEHEEPIDVKLRTHIPVFKEFKEVINNPDSSDCNFLLEGDNLHSLKLLERTHKGRIDVIYIDPPYNTLNDDFAYGDKFMDEEDGFIHSKWLSFMKERLDIAYKLLSPNGGLIFMSIDDHEMCNLKLLSDQVFGEDNFVSCIINQSANSVFGTKAAHKDKTFVKVKDYVLVYKKGNINLQPLYTPSKIHLFDSHEFVLSRDKRMSTTEWFKNNYSDKFKQYNMSINKQNIQKIMNVDDEFRREVMNKLIDSQYSTSPYSKDDLSDKEKESLKQGEIINHNGILLIQEGNGSGLIRFLRPLRDSCQLIDGEWRKCDILGDVWNTSAGYGNINAEGNVKFANGKKPLILLKQILKTVNNKNALVLDFFAGSGTTGHAVMEQNAEDEGNRHFILCTNNEISATRTLEYLHSKGKAKNIKSSGKNKTTQSKLDTFFEDNQDVYKELIVDNHLEYETYGICQSVTYVRLCNAIKDFKENIRYFQTEMIDKYNEDLDELLYEASILLTELENMSIVDDESICIADDDGMVDEIIENASSKLRLVYIADDVLLDSKQNDFFNKHHIEVKRIPQYYYKEI